MRSARWILVLLLLAGVSAPAAQQNPPVAQDDAATTSLNVPTIRITSPLGRTGLAVRLRIVAQIHVPSGISLSPVAFFVDGTQVGTVEAGPPYTVDWTDVNPFERREIVVQASDSTGRMIRDAVTLPPFELHDKTEITSILLETSVYNKKGDFISDLAPTVFAVAENGIEQKIDLVARETIPTNLVLLVDNSQSMSRRMDFVRRATERMTAMLREHDRVIVAPFNARIGTITGPTNDRRTIAEAISSMRSGGGTALLDCVVEATRLLDGLDGRRVVILLTDGYDENSTLKVDEALRRTEEAQATFYVVGIGGVAGISLRGKELLQRVAARTGGRMFFPPRELELVSVAESIATDAHSRYLITYTPADQKRDGSWRGVTVGVPEGLTARTRAGYFAPPPPPIRPAIEFTAMDASRNYVDLTAEDIEVLEDGVPQSVDTFQEAVDPVSIVLALDASGSMKKSADMVMATAKEFVVKVRPEDNLALIMFADEPKFAHTLATNREWTLDAIDKYVPLGGTALYDALWNAMMHLKGVKGRRTVVVMTDGRDENNPGTAPGSVHTLADVLSLHREVGAVIYSVALGTKVDHSVLDRLADQAAGQVYVATDVSQLGAQYAKVIDSLRRRYVISYTSSNSTHNGQWRRVEIRAKASELTVTSPGGYFAPEQ